MHVGVDMGSVLGSSSGSPTFYAASLCCPRPFLCVQLRCAPPLSGVAVHPRVLAHRLVAVSSSGLFFSRASVAAAPPPFPDTLASSVHASSFHASPHPRIVFLRRCAAPLLLVKRRAAHRAAPHFRLQPFSASRRHPRASCRVHFARHHHPRRSCCFLLVRTFCALFLAVLLALCCVPRRLHFHSRWSTTLLSCSRARCHSVGQLPLVMPLAALLIAASFCPDLFCALGLHPVAQFHVPASISRAVRRGGGGAPSCDVRLN